jgi:hypothetical protein
VFQVLVAMMEFCEANTFVSAVYVPVPPIR